MIRGVGIDSIEIDRFKHWHLYAQATLERVFSPQEIEYCLSVPKKSAERFAARFAAREALYKALSGFSLQKSIPFLTLCKNVSIEKSKNGNPQAIVNWQSIFDDNTNVSKKISVHLSLTHNKTTAIAMIVVESCEV